MDRNADIQTPNLLFCDRFLVAIVALCVIIASASLIISQFASTDLSGLQTDYWVLGAGALALLTIVFLFVPLLLRATRYKKFVNMLQEKISLLEHQARAFDLVAIVAETNVRGDIIYANQNFCDVSGFTREELLGQNHRILNSGHHSKEFFRDMYRTIAGKQPWRGEICNRKKDGEIYWAESTILPRIDKHGEIERYTIVRIDVTERRRDQEQLGLYAYEIEQANSELLQLDHLREELLAAVSHELRTPLACVHECVELISDGTVGIVNERQSELLSLAGRNLLFLDRLVSDLLDAAAINAGSQLILNRETVNCYSIVKEVVDLLETRAYQRRQKFTLDFRERGLWVSGDKRRLMQVMINLISNAIKFGGEGNEIICGYERINGGKVRLFVQDFGQGLEEEQGSRVFERFYRAPSNAGQNTEGLGLGLHLCKQIVEAHGGSINCESVPGEGTTFSFILEENYTHGVSSDDGQKTYVGK